MEFSIPILGDPETMSLTTGHYRLYGSIPWYLPDFLVETYVGMVMGKTVEIRDFVIDNQAWKADVFVYENPIPLALIVGGIIASVITVGVALTVTKVERIVNVSPFTGIALGALGLAFAWKAVK